MENKKVIIFGNGIEAHFNKKLQNFNIDIKQWIKELNKNKYKRSTLLNNFKNGDNSFDCNSYYLNSKKLLLKEQAKDYKIFFGKK